MSKTLEEMNRINKKLEGLDEFIPSDLQQIILLNTMLLQPLGKMYGSATHEYRQAYANRKYAQGNILVHSEGTGIEKQGNSEVQSYQLRQDEAAKEGEMIRWKHAYLSTHELIQSQKLVLKSMMTELNNSNEMG